MPQNKPDTRPDKDKGTKPKPILSDFFQVLYLQIEKTMNLFRIWHLVVYHPREFFEYFFGPQSDFRVRSTILLGVSQIEIDTKHHTILSPFRFIAVTASISIPLFAIANHILSIEENINIKIVTEFFAFTQIQFLNEIIIAILIMIFILINSLFWAGYEYLFFKKRVLFRKLLDFTAYCQTTLFLTLSIGFTIIALLDLLGLNMPQGNGQFQGVFDFSIYLIESVIYLLVSVIFLYILVEVYLRLLIANQIIVLHDVLKQSYWRIALMFGVGFMIYILLFSLTLLIVISMPINVSVNG